MKNILITILILLGNALQISTAFSFDEENQDLCLEYKNIQERSNKTCDYFLNYGEKYCKRFVFENPQNFRKFPKRYTYFLLFNKNKFEQEMKRYEKWSVLVAQCLQNKLNELIFEDRSCENVDGLDCNCVEKISFKMHPDCYTVDEFGNDGPDRGESLLCKLHPKTLMAIKHSVDLKDILSGGKFTTSLDQMRETARKCRKEWED